LDLFQRFLISAIPTTLLEVIVVLVGNYYLFKNPNAPNANRYLVYFLWFTLLIEILGLYSPLAYFTKYEYFGFVKGTLFERNIWIYNVYTLVSFSFFIYYLMSFVERDFIKKRSNIIIITYLTIGVLNLLFSDVFFKADSIYTVTIGTILLLCSIIIFYFELLRSDKIINLKKYLPVYISIGVLVHYLCVTPLDIFSRYFKANNELFVAVKANFLLATNIFMYSIFIIGFLVCSKGTQYKRDN